jgi:hypothetical protein
VLALIGWQFFNRRLDFCNCTHKNKISNSRESASRPGVQLKASVSFR